MMRFAAAALCLAFAPLSATAQNQQLSAANQSVATISSQDVVNLLNANDVSAQVIRQTDGSEFVQATVSNGGTFYIGMRACEGSTGVRRCEMLQPYALFDASGLTFNQINELHLNKLSTGTIVLLPDSQGIVGAKIHLAGGVQNDNLLEEMALFLFDVDKTVSAISPGAIADVNFVGESPIAGLDARRVSKHLKADEAIHINAVGANAPKFLPDSLAPLVE